MHFNIVLKKKKKSVHSRKIYIISHQILEHLHQPYTLIGQVVFHDCWYTVQQFQLHAPVFITKVLITYSHLLWDCFRIKGPTACIGSEVQRLEDMHTAGARPQQLKWETNLYDTSHWPTMEE